MQKWRQANANTSILYKSAGRCSPDDMWERKDAEGCCQWQAEGRSERSRDGGLKSRVISCTLEIVGYGACRMGRCTVDDWKWKSSLVGWG